MICNAKNDLWFLPVEKTKNYICLFSTFFNIENWRTYQYLKPSCLDILGPICVLEMIIVVDIIM